LQGVPAVRWTGTLIGGCVALLILSGGCYRPGVRQTPTPAATSPPVQTTVPVTVSLPDLQYFAQGATHVLLRQLRASPAWRVGLEPGGDDIVCAYRPVAFDNERIPPLPCGVWDDPNGGYVTVSPSFEITKKDNLLQQLGVHGEVLTAVGPLAGTVPLEVEGDVPTYWDASDYGLESCLAVGESSLWFVFFERSPRTDRIYTRQALEWLGRFLKQARQSESQISRRGYTPSLMWADGIRHGRPSLRVEDGLQGGIYWVVGWVNPGEPGYTYVRIFDLTHGVALSEDQYCHQREQLCELTGWSGDPDELFLYETEVTVYKGGFHDFFDARFELWSHPDNGAPDRKLVETVKRVSGWQR